MRLCALALSFVWATPALAGLPLAARDLLLDVALAGERWVVVGARGHVLYSDDGIDWASADTSVPVLLTAVVFGSRGAGWAVGHDGVVLYSADRGERWKPVHEDPSADGPLLDVWMDRAGRNGIAVGAYSQYLVTGDGGRSWKAVPFPVAQAPDPGADEDGLPLDVHLNAIREGPGGALYIAAEAGHLFRSEDQGASWVALPSPYVGSFFGVLPLDDGAVLAFGLRGHLYRSEDGGVHWVRLETETQEMLTDGIRLRDGRLLIVGLGGAVLVSGDGGRSFTLHVRPDRVGFSAVAQHPDGRILAVGEKGVLELALGRRASRPEP